MSEVRFIIPDHIRTLQRIEQFVAERCTDPEESSTDSLVRIWEFVREELRTANIGFGCVPIAPDLRVALRAATGDDAIRKNFDDIRRTRACYRCGASPEHCECPDAYEQ